MLEARFGPELNPSQLTESHISNALQGQLRTCCGETVCAIREAAKVTHSDKVELQCLLFEDVTLQEIRTIGVRPAMGAKIILRHVAPPADHPPPALAAEPGNDFLAMLDDVPSRPPTGRRKRPR